MKTITKHLLILFGCLAIGGIKAQTITFNYTGAVQTWTVPACVTQITVTAYGAQGGGANGGLGGEAVATIPVTGGTILDVYVGSNPTAQIGPGGYNGGGASTVDPCGGPPDDGYPGGGASDVRISPFTLSNRVIVGGGGGGQGWSSAAGGSGGGLIGGNGQIWATATAGMGGTQAAGGAGGTYSPDPPAGSGSLGQGGAADSYMSFCSGGAGGGGYYGGGGGFVSSGGGGSSYVAYPGNINTSTTAGIRSGNGQVVITWNGSGLTTTGNVINNVSCNGGSNGKASGIVSGGSAPFTYAWAPSGGTHDTASGLSAGTYTITVTAACGGSSSASVTITQPAAIVVTATTSSNVTCNAGSNGASASTVSGGTTPYTYSWTGGSTNSTATGLTAGTYTLNVTDMNGCTASASTVVTQPNILSDTAMATANVLCHGDSSGSAFTMASGGTMPYTYLWTPGGGTTDTAVGLKAGSYTVTVSDACGASATASVSVTQPSALSITSHSAPDNGHGVGTAVVSVSGGVGPYTYLWAGGKTTDSIGGLTKGTYCVDVKDANGCTDSLCVVVKTTAGIDGITGNSGQIIVYPNPNNGQFTIASSISGASTVEIYNILGEKVFTKNLSTTKGTNQINVSNQPNGVYLYRVISESGDLLGQGKITLQK